MSASKRFIRCVVAVALSAPIAVGAQVVDSLSLVGRTNLMIGIGLTGSRDAAVGATGVRTHASGEIGSFAFNHWVSPALAVTISTAVLDADAGADATAVHVNATTPLLFGISYSPRAVAVSSTIRPFASAAIGPYFHSVSDASGRTASASARSESVPGAKLAVGANWFVARHFNASLETAYHAVGRFDVPDASGRSPSGFAMTLGFGFAWGGRY